MGSKNRTKRKFFHQLNSVYPSSITVRFSVTKFLSSYIILGPNTGPINVNRLCGIDNSYSIKEFKSYLQSLVKEVNYNRKITFWRYPVHELLSGIIHTSEFFFIINFIICHKESGPNCINNSIENDIDEFLKESKTSTTKLIDMNEQVTRHL